MWPPERQDLRRSAPQFGEVAEVARQLVRRSCWGVAGSLCQCATQRGPILSESVEDAIGTPRQIGIGIVGRPTNALHER